MTPNPNLPTTPIVPIEDRFKAPDGSIDSLAAREYLNSLQKRATDLSTDEVREAITLIRILRRTNTGPAAGKKASGSKKTTVVRADPDDLIDL